MTMKTVRQSTRKKFTSRLTSIIVLTATLVLVLSGCAKAPPKIYRVGVLSGLGFIADITDGFKAKMAELGYVEGQNIAYDVQKTDFDMDAYGKTLQKFVDDKVDLIVVFPTEASILARTITEGTNIPVVFTYALVEGMGIVDDIRNPGGNLTGVRYPGADIAVKRLELLRQLAPDAKRIIMPYQRGYPIVAPQVEALQQAAAAAGVTLIEAPADDADGVRAAFAAQSDQEPIDAILMLVEPLAVTPGPFEAMAKYAYDHKILIGGAMMAAGGYESVFDVGVKSYDAGVQAAPIADKILKGTAPGSIPVASSDSYMIVNYKAAQKLGITVPENVLAQADQIIR
jgi:putative tryptophan/tyrosine transport system substrate-binding protein